MWDVIINTFLYLLLIALGFTLKKTHALPKEAVTVVSSLVVNLSLPALLLRSANGMVLDGRVLSYMAIGIGVSVVMMGLSLVLFRKKEPVLKAVMMLSASGIDVGNFVLPYVVAFCPTEGVFALSAFNIGNTLMIQGFDYLVASKVAASGKPYGIKNAMKRLFSSVPFDVYVLVLIMGLFRFQLPEVPMRFVGFIADANVFLVMMMIGLKLELSFAPGEARPVLSVLLLRFLGGILLAVLTWLLPIPQIVKIVLTVTYFGPPSSVSNIYAKNLGFNGPLTSQVNVISIFSGMILITSLLIILMGI